MSDIPSVTFKSFDEALDYLEKEGKEIVKKVEVFHRHIEELTGYTPNTKIGPLEVVKIIRKAFPNVITANELG